jgi:hypothetical protein
MVKAIVIRVLVVAAIGGLFVSRACAGTLEKFEEDATKDRSKDDSGRDRRASARDGEDSHPWDGFVGEFGSSLIAGLVLAPADASWARISGDADHLAELDLEARELGDPLVPFVRLDFAYQEVQSDVEALDYRAQVGYGPFALELNQTRYEETDPSSRLDFYRLWGLYRLSYSERIEVDLGAGGLILDGNDRSSGLSLTMPVLVRPYDWLLVEFRPIWSTIHGSDIDEYEAGLLFNWESLALKVGYRWTHSPNMSLDGPFFGLSIRL